jgi:hypothetical protein
LVEERPDGSLVLAADTSADAILCRHNMTPATLEEFEAEYVPVQPPDGEGKRVPEPAGSARTPPVAFDDAAWTEALSGPLPRRRDADAWKERQLSIPAGHADSGGTTAGSFTTRLAA